jgi:hypothetical protein
MQNDFSFRVEAARPPRRLQASTPAGEPPQVPLADGLAL